VRQEAEAEATEDVDEVADILTDAFGEDPVIGWMVPYGLPRRERYVAGFMRTWVRFMIDHEGTALISPGRDAVLVWEPSERAPIPDAHHSAFTADVAAATGPAAARCLQLIELLDAHYPSGLPPHVHGALAAVRPGTTSRGAFLGLAVGLLRHLYTRKLGVYCEASSESSAALWQRFGAGPIGPQILLPDGGVPLTPLFIHPDAIANHPAAHLLLAAPGSGPA
jgi:hypothetical protein